MLTPVHNMTTHDNATYLCIPQPADGRRVLRRDELATGARLRHELLLLLLAFLALAASVGSRVGIALCETRLRLRAQAKVAEATEITEAAEVVSERVLHLVE